MARSRPSISRSVSYSPTPTSTNPALAVASGKTGSTSSARVKLSRAPSGSPLSQCAAPRRCSPRRSSGVISGQAPASSPANGRRGGPVRSATTPGIRDPSAALRRRRPGRLRSPRSDYPGGERPSGPTPPDRRAPEMPERKAKKMVRGGVSSLARGSDGARGSPLSRNRVRGPGTSRRWHLSLAPSSLRGATGSASVWRIEEAWFGLTRVSVPTFAPVRERDRCDASRGSHPPPRLPPCLHKQVISCGARPTASGEGKGAGITARPSESHSEIGRRASRGAPPGFP
jgi:hypothetical protein